MLKARPCIDNALIVMISLFALLKGSAFACDIPVFRYAMAYWDADDYEVTVFHRGELSAEDGEAARLLEDLAARSNLRPSFINIEAPDPSAPMPHDAGAPLPLMEIRYPLSRGAGPPLWAGPLNSESVKAWGDSPVRSAIAESLLDGKAAVWVFIGSGNRRADAEAESVLRSELARLERVLLLPTASAPGDVSFAVVPLDRDDPKERALFRMLMMTERDLTDMAGRPMAFPIYGRARILHALVGAGINAYTIADAAEFVVGPCSCQVKALNPGIDMLLAVDWDEDIEPSDWAIEPELGGMAGFTARMDEAERLLSAPPPPPVAEPVPLEPEAAPSEPRWRTHAILLTVLAVGAGVALLSLFRGRSR